MASLLCVGCRQTVHEEDIAVVYFDANCTEANLLRGENRKLWRELTEAIDRGEIAREELRFEPSRPFFSSNDRSSLQSGVETNVGEVELVKKGSNARQSGVFRGAMPVLLNGKRLLDLHDLYLASEREGIYILSDNVIIKSCFAEVGEVYMQYVGRQK